MEIATPRLKLRSWRAADAGAFARLNEDAIVMADLGGPLTRSESDGKLEAYMAADELTGYSRLVVESHDGEFLGYCGVMAVEGEHPLGSHDEIGWRFHRHAWGQGYATEAAVAALRDVFSRTNLTEVLAYTHADNLRSQAVMQRLDLRRDERRDFTLVQGKLGSWSGQVWVADATRFSGANRQNIST